MKAKGTARPNSCNVLSLGADSRRFWNFNTGGGKVALAHESSGPLNGPLPKKDVAKDWRELLQPKLNIAWLPADQAFLRVVHLPAADAAELRSMLELQLEKLSPLPLTQMVWSFEPLPKGENELQSVILVFAARATVEQFLGRLEGQGYMPDRLEVPAIHELLATPVSEDGVWIYPRVADGRVSCLVAWWYGGVLRDLGLVNVPNDATAAATLSGHIGNLAWAGELEGWLTSAPRWFVVANQETLAVTAALWPVDEPLQVVEPPQPLAVAEWSAGKSAGGQSQTNLLPPEYGSRYRQQYVDRLWMRALAATIALYVIGVAAYFAWFGVVKYQATGVAARAAGLSLEYTNTVKIKQQGDILQEQSNLRFAALDTWRLVSENLPDGLKLSSMSLSRGKSVSLFGDAPSDAFDKLADFNAAMARASLASNGGVFFTNVSPPQSQQRPPVISWSFNLDLSGAEIP